MRKNPGNQVPQFGRCIVTEPIVSRAPLREAYLGEKNSQRTPSFFSGRPNGRLQRLRSHRAALDGLVGNSTHPPPFGRLPALHTLRTRPRQTQSKPRQNPRACESTSAGGPCLLRVLPASRACVTRMSLGRPLRLTKPNGSGLTSAYTLPYWDASVASKGETNRG